MAWGGDMAKTRVLALAAAAFAVIGGASASADAVQDFYKGRTLDIYVGSSESPGALTSYAQLVGQVISKYIPGNPRSIIRFMPGGAGIKAANFIYGVAPQDGSVYGFISRSFILEPLLVGQATFDPTKLKWIGSPSRDTSVGTVWAAGTKVRTIKEAMSEQVIVGGTALSNDTGLYPTMLNTLAGTKFKVVTGYKSVPEVDLAMERGEVQGKIGGTWNSLNSGRTAGWVKDHKVYVLVQFGLEKSNRVPADIPLAPDLARTPEDRQIMQLILAPTAIGHLSFMGPGVPADRFAAVRDAYNKTMVDPEFIDAMARQNLTVDPVYGDEVKKIVDEIYALPPNVIKRAKELIPPS
jgi:tripartite-type tricarboxylate transporter receptor subunit TctC